VSKKEEIRKVGLHTFGFEYKAEHKWVVCCPESTSIIVFRTFEDIGETDEVDTQPYWMIAAVSFKSRH